MQVNITGDNIELTPTLREYVETKLQKIQARFNNIQNVHVILSVNNYEQKAEAEINLAKAHLFADSVSEDMYASIDGLIHKLERQVIKHKEKLNHRGNGEA